MEPRSSHLAAFSSSVLPSLPHISLTSSLGAVWKIDFTENVWPIVWVCEDLKTSGPADDFLPQKLRSKDRNRVTWETRYHNKAHPWFCFMTAFLTGTGGRCGKGSSAKWQHLGVAFLCCFKNPIGAPFMALSSLRHWLVFGWPMACYCIIHNVLTHLATYVLITHYCLSCHLVS